VNCRKVCSLLSAYIDGELTGAETLRIREHLSKCSTCRDEHESLLSTKLMISSLRVAEPDPGFEERLLECVRSVSPERPWLHRIQAAFALGGPGLRVRAAALFAAASLIILALSVRLTVATGAQTSASRMAVRQQTPPATYIIREQDLQFAHETFERPQPVSYRVMAEEQPFDRGSAVQPLTAWDPAASTSSR
jgi:anti-sigma factor RsiW